MNRYRKYKPPLKWVLPGSLYRKLEPGLRDVSIISYPKSGRTWHRAMLGHYMEPGYDPFVAKREMRYFLHLSHKTFGQRHAWTHNGTELVHPKSTASIDFCNPVDWEGKRVLLITRDVKDLIVSCFYQARYRTGVTDLDISDFIRSTDHGIDKMLLAFERWHALSQKTRAFERITYEDLHVDPVDGLRRTVELFGTRPFTVEMAQQAVEATRFEKMKKNETQTTGTDGASNEAAKSLKVRSGKIGSFVNDLSEVDIDFIDGRVKAMGNPFERI